jgi:2-dehydro-3-deoxyglucarate aldolase
MHFRDRIKSGQPLIGTLVTLPSPEVVEILCRSDLDWLFLDLEHSAMEAAEAQRLLQAAGGLKPCLARVSTSNESGIRKALDSGADGVILPQVMDRAQAAELVSLTKYAPLGRRSVGLARAAGYGLQLNDYLTRANQEVAVVIQIEHIKAVDGIADILSVAHIDAVFVGPYDLSASMGIPGQVSDPDVTEAIEQVLLASKRFGVAAGIFTSEAAQAKTMFEQGFSLVASGSDALFLGRGLAQELKMLRR